MGWVVLVCCSRPAVAACAGDCSSDGTVAVNELVVGVNMALGNIPVEQCAGFDSNGDRQVAVNELVAAVANALNGCPFTGRYTGRVDVGDGETATVQLLVAPNGEANGSLTVGASAAVGRAALRLDIPGVSLIGTVDLDTGDYHLTGSVAGPDGPVPVDVSGTLPLRVGDIGTLRLEIGDDSFDDGTIAAGDGRPTPTPTERLATPTPTPTAMPAGNFPTPGSSCLNGSISLVFSNASGTNSYVNLAGGVSIGKGTARITNAGVVNGFGGEYVPCALNIGDVIQRVTFTVLLINSGPIEVGTPYRLGTDQGGQAFDYLEIPTTNPLGARGWSASSGSLVIDSVDGGTVHFHVADAVMVPEPSFSTQQPATGTFTINAGGVGTQVTDSAVLTREQPMR
jgi:hypothetical protein